VYFAQNWILTDQSKGRKVKKMSDSFTAAFKSTDAVQDDQDHPGRENFSELVQKTISIGYVVCSTNG
jgi:hypothetical protein